MIDADFAIERPKRVYRHGLHLMTGHSSMKSLRHKDSVGRDGIDENDIDLDNPFAREMVIANGEAHGQKISSGHQEEGDEQNASQHTFFIVNTQRRLKLVAKNAVSSPVSSYTLLILATNAPVHRQYGAYSSSMRVDWAESIRFFCSPACQRCSPMACRWCK